MTTTTRLLTEQLTAKTTAELIKILTTYSAVEVGDLAKFFRVRRKAEAVISELIFRGMDVDRSWLDVCVSEAIARARAERIAPESFGETFSSLGELPWPVRVPVSAVDQRLLAHKEAVKMAVVSCIRENHAITLDDLDEYCADNLSAQAYAIFPYLLNEYIAAAHQAGLVPAVDFPAFRDFVAVADDNMVRAF